MLENDHSYWHYQGTARKKSIVKELLPGSAACLYLVICSCGAFSYLINFFFCFIDFLRLQSDREIYVRAAVFPIVRKFHSVLILNHQ